ncbi:GNAT family N-acetyltransferase [Streptomyces sp. NPDC058683]|uniref:GNAT family N-acetyltransferase n=1 Tax=Streptomyces sp. NPDC058683 TaxID=3346597 RepID=UPI003669D3F3
MPEPYIRAALPDDDEELSALDRAIWSYLHAVQPEPQPPYDPFFSGRHAPEDTLVAELDRRIVGYVRLGFAYNIASNAHVRQIQGLAVAEEARGHGVARTLLRAVMEEARGRGARRIRLGVLGHNAPARRLYESEGFAVEGVLPGEFLLGGEYVDDVIMGRAL